MKMATKLGLLAVLLGLPAILKAQNIYVANNGAGFNNGSIAECAPNGQMINSNFITSVNHPVEITIGGGNLFVVSENGILSEYGLDGHAINTNLISGLAYYGGIAVFGTNIFAGNQNGIGEYTTSGATNNANFIPGIHPAGMAISGTNLFVASGGTIGEYTTSGATVNASLISGLNGGLDGIAISGTNLFVLSQGSAGIVSEYTTSGALVNANLITESGSSSALGFAISGTDIFIANYNGVNNNGGTIGEYTTSGATINYSQITNLDWPYAVAVTPAPQLNIATIGNQSILFYPALSTNYVLQTVTNLASTNWQTVSNAVPVVGVVVTNNLPASFYRLVPAQ